MRRRWRGSRCPQTPGTEHGPGCSERKPGCTGWLPSCRRGWCASENKPVTNQPQATPINTQIYSNNELRLREKNVHINFTFSRGGQLKYEAAYQACLVITLVFGGVKRRGLFFVIRKAARDATYSVHWKVL